ncbi:DUF2846 domain-containing protein [Rhodoferax ferrireducens]|uniref:DUF2846 domain-containing protein n=1 Tax=Rhodoferax ferrireducens TaxID=192843 RepID=UPI00298E886E|nr:DUF2846 domain-containing protein [Rhodoferax ferrireducens]WPC67815.1 DUF2846 domain-containing protein [Rhodoferax ferrireducens]
MSISSTITSTTRRVVLGLSLLPVLILAGCATANGPAFTQVQAAPAGMAQLYLYRKSALYAVGASYAVTNMATKQTLGELYNASYLLLPLKAGKQVISVAEGGFASAKTFEVQAEAGKNYFVEYDSSKGLLLGLGLLSGSAAKTETQALADLKDLRRAN